MLLIIDKEDFTYNFDKLIAGTTYTTKSRILILRIKKIAEA